MVDEIRGISEERINNSSNDLMTKTFIAQSTLGNEVNMFMFNVLMFRIPTISSSIHLGE